MPNVDITELAEQVGLPEPPDGVMNIAYGEDAPIEIQLEDLDGELHQDLLSELKRRRDFSKEYTKDRHEDWDRVREHQKMYLNLDRSARAGNRSQIYGEKEMPFERSVTIPLSKATLDVLLTQVMSIYASRTPMIQIAADNGGDPVQAKIVEAMIAYDVAQMRAFSAQYAMFSDAFMFGNGYMYDSWEIDEGMTYEFEPTRRLGRSESDESTTSGHQSAHMIPGQILEFHSGLSKMVSSLGTGGRQARPR